jgi:hypothetical protein
MDGFRSSARRKLIEMRRVKRLCFWGRQRHGMMDGTSTVESKSMSHRRAGDITITFISFNSYPSDGGVAGEASESLTAEGGFVGERQGGCASMASFHVQGFSWRLTPLWLPPLTCFLFSMPPPFLYRLRHIYPVDFRFKLPAVSYR